MARKSISVKQRTGGGKPDNSAKIDLLRCHLEGIVTACNVLRETGHRLVGDQADTVLSFAVITLAEISGWRADACLALFGDGSPADQCIGGWEDWVSSPVEAEARKKLAGKAVSHG